MPIEHAAQHNRYRGVRVAVLGASGFIGRWVARGLCAQGAQVYLVVRDKLVARGLFSRYSIHGEIIESDLRDSDAVGKFFRKIRPSITFNLASYGVSRSQRDEETAYQINADLVKAICDAIGSTRNQDWKGQDLVHVGSAFEYGPIGGSLSEDSIPNPTTLYGKSKLAGTELLEQYCAAGKVKGFTTRLFTVYGPGEHQGRLLPSLLDAARRAMAIKLTSGEQQRDFTYVGDVAEGLLRLGLTASGSGETVNLATGRLTSVRRFVETAARILGIPDDKLLFGSIPAHYEEIDHAEVGLGRLRRLIGWVPPTGISDGICQTVDFENVHGAGGKD